MFCSFKQVNASFAHVSFKLWRSPPSARLQMSEQQLSAGPDLGRSALTEQIRLRSSDLRRRKWEICVTLAGPRKKDRNLRTAHLQIPGQRLKLRRPQSAETQTSSGSHTFHARFFTIRLTVCSSFSTKSTFFCVVREARTALWLRQASLALSYESLAVMNFRQEFPTRCQPSPHTFSDGANGERSSSLSSQPRPPRGQALTW